MVVDRIPMVVPFILLHFPFLSSSLIVSSSTVTVPMIPVAQFISLLSIFIFFDVVSPNVAPSKKGDAVL
jgi:hypothetical protein